MHLHENVQTYTRRENYARYKNIFDTIIAAFFNQTLKIVHK